MPSGRDHSHAPRFDPFRHGQANIAESDDPGGSSVQLREAGITVKHFLAWPFPFELKAIGLVQLTRQNNHHPNHMLGNGNAVQAAGVGDGDVALNHLRKQHVRRSSRCEMEPFELFGDLEILRAKSHGEQHVGVGQLSPTLFRGPREGYLDAWKLSLELLGGGQGKIWKAAESGRASERNTDFGHCCPPGGLSRASCWKQDSCFDRLSMNGNFSHAQYLFRSP